MKQILSFLGKTWRGGRNGKLAIGCGSLLMVCAVCSFCSFLFSLTPQYREQTAGQTVVAPTVTKQAAAVAATKTAQPTNTKAPTNTPAPTATPAPPTATLRPADALQALAQAQFKNNFKAAQLANVGGKQVATVDYNLGAQWDESGAVNSAVRDFVAFSPQLFKANAAVDILELRSFAPFKDVYGNEKSEVALKFTVSRATANKINWQNVDRHRIGDALTLSGDGVYVHTALKAAWLKYISQ